MSDELQSQTLRDRLAVWVLVAASESPVNPYRIPLVRRIPNWALRYREGIE